MQIVVGRIRRPHGVRGEVSVEVRTDEPDRRFIVGGKLSTDPAERGPLTLTASRWHSGSLLATFAEVPDRIAAEQLRGTWLVMDSAGLGPTGDPDEFYDHELIGLTAVTTDGEVVGPVTDVRHFGQDLLVIKSKVDDELLVPFVAAIVPQVDVAGGRVVIDPPPGLLEP
jgi:16S rRNA processing protein RimM